MFIFQTPHYSISILTTWTTLIELSPDCAYCNEHPPLQMGHLSLFRLQSIHQRRISLSSAMVTHTTSFCLVEFRTMWKRSAFCITLINEKYTHHTQADRGLQPRRWRLRAMGMRTVRSWYAPQHRLFACTKTKRFGRFTSVIRRYRVLQSTIRPRRRRRCKARSLPCFRRRLAAVEMREPGS